MPRCVIAICSYSVQTRLGVSFPHGVRHSATALDRCDSVSRIYRNITDKSHSFVAVLLINIRPIFSVCFKFWKISPRLNFHDFVRFFILSFSVQASLTSATDRLHRNSIVEGHSFLVTLSLVQSRWKGPPYLWPGGLTYAQRPHARYEKNVLV